jgi:hypothetical protein
MNAGAAADDQHRCGERPTTKERGTVEIGRVKKDMPIIGSLHAVKFSVWDPLYSQCMCAVNMPEDACTGR